MAFKYPGVTERRLDNTLDHPELEKAYPQFSGDPMRIGKGAGEGGFYDQNNRIDVLPDTPAAAKPIALHEIQHRIQKRRVCRRR